MYCHVLGSKSDDLPNFKVLLTIENILVLNVMLMIAASILNRPLANVSLTLQMCALLVCRYVIYQWLSKQLFMIFAMF